MDKGKEQPCKERFQGFFYSEKMKGKIFCANKHEFYTIIGFELDPAILSIQYEALVIFYPLDGKLHKYVPDYILGKEDGKHIVEAVYAPEHITKKKKAKAIAAQDYVSRHSDVYRDYGFIFWRDTMDMLQRLGVTCDKLNSFTLRR